MLFQITEICLKYICHDPNYNYDDDEEAMDTEADDEEEEWVAFSLCVCIVWVTESKMEFGHQGNIIYQILNPLDCSPLYVKTMNLILSPENIQANYRAES